MQRLCLRGKIVSRKGVREERVRLKSILNVYGPLDLLNWIQDQAREWLEALTEPTVSYNVTAKRIDIA